MAPVVEGQGGVRVLVQGREGELFQLEVLNYGPTQILVDTERVVMLTAAGARARRSGAGGGRYDVPPGGRHALEVRFPLDGLRTGDRVAVSLAGAVTVDGQPLRMPPLEFVADCGSGSPGGPRPPPIGDRPR